VVGGTGFEPVTAGV